MSEKYHIRAATEADEKNIQFLWSEIFKIPFPAQRYNWLYKLSNLKPITYLAFENFTEQAVGVSALHVNEYLCLGKKCKVAIAADFGVMPKYRVFGPAKALQRNIINSVEIHEVDFILAYPNKKAMKLMESVGYSSVSKTTMCVKFIDSTDIIGKIVKSRYAAAIFAKVYNYLVALLDAVFITIFRKWTIQTIDSVEELIKANVQMPSNPSPPKIEKVKDLRYLFWRYELNPTIKHPITLVMRSNNGDIRGLAVISICNSKLTVFDIIGVIKKTDYLALINKITIYSRSKNIAQIEIIFTGCTVFRNMLMLNGFIVKQYERELLIYPPSYKDTFTQYMKKSPIFESDMDF